MPDVLSIDGPRPVAVVLGAGPGLGQAIGAAFADAGADVVLVARDGARLAELAEEIDAADFVAVDLTDEAALRSAFGGIRASLGDPAIVVHNPSLAIEAPATRTSRADLMAGFELTVGSLLVAAHEVAPAMRQSGRGAILVTRSSAAFSGSTWSAALGAQKAALRNLTFSLAAELGPAGVHVAMITIDGFLGNPGFEYDRIAGEFVRLADRAVGRGEPDADWQTEVVWPATAD